MLGLDEGVGGAVAGVEEDDVGGVAAGGVDGEDDEGVFEDLGHAVDGAFFKEDELAGGEFEGGSVAEEEAGAAREDEEVLVAGGVVMGWGGGVGAEDAGAGVRLVGEAGVDEHGGGGGGEVAGDGVDVEDGGVGGFGGHDVEFSLAGGWGRGNRG